MAGIFYLAGIGLAGFAGYSGLEWFFIFIASSIMAIGYFIIRVPQIHGIISNDGAIAIPKLLILQIVIYSILTAPVITVNGKRQYLWRAVDQDGDVIGILMQSRRNRGVAFCFFRKLFKGQASMPWKIITDKLRSYQAALREIAPSLTHITDQYENNRAEVSHQSTRQQKRQMRRFKSPGQAQRFLSFHGLVSNLFRQQRHLLSAAGYRVLRGRAFVTWEQVTCAC